MKGISDKIVIMTRDELREVEKKSFLQGVKRGKFEARSGARPRPFLKPNSRAKRDRS
jgi:hypothetical protein